MSRHVTMTAEVAMSERDRWTASAVEVQSDGNVTKSIVGIVVSPKVTVQEGGRVLVTSPLALTLGAGAAGIAFALLSRLVRR